MSGLEERITELSEELDENATLSQPHKSNALSNKVTTVLSTSFADTEIREALRTLDERKIQNNPETRRRLRLDAQKEVIDCNSAIIQDFGQVAEVRFACLHYTTWLRAKIATEANRLDYSKPE